MKTDKNTKWTALYERLSRDNDTLGDSVSIAHQKAYLRKYADEHGFANCHDYTDDGWSGGTFDRPAWNQMVADIEAGKVGMVIVKDMSRVGRDYLQTGFYTEIDFARNGVHFMLLTAMWTTSEAIATNLRPCSMFSMNCICMTNRESSGLAITQKVHQASR